MTPDEKIHVAKIVNTLEARGFALRNNLLSYFSRKARCFVAVALEPIPPNAIIPADDLEDPGRLQLKVWPLEFLPETIIADF